MNRQSSIKNPGVEFEPEENLCFKSTCLGDIGPSDIQYSYDSSHSTNFIRLLNNVLNIKIFSIQPIF